MFVFLFLAGLAPGSTKGEVVVDKTETRVKTDHQIVEPNGETTHLEHENVDTVEKTKPAMDPVQVPVQDTVHVGDPADVNEGEPVPQDGVAAAVRNDDDVQVEDSPDEVNKQEDTPYAHNGEILLEDWQFICKFTYEYILRTHWKVLDWAPVYIYHIEDIVRLQAYHLRDFIGYIVQKIWRHASRLAR